MVSARAGALHALVEFEKGHTERLRDALDEAKLVGREHAFAFELAHGVLRRERLLDHVLEGFAHRGLPKDVPLRCTLRLGAYQLLFVAGMPAHAAVHETVELVRANKGFANAMLRQLSASIESRAADPARPTEELPLSPTRVLLLQKPLPDGELDRLALVHSLPFFLMQRWEKRIGRDVLRQVAEAASTVPEVFLRIGAGLDRDAVRADLAAAEVVCDPAEHPRMLRWSSGNSPFGTRAFRDGHFVVQDPTALAAAEAVPCSPGDTVVDLCAAPGTKTMALAERVRPGGTVWAFDPAPERRARIVENVARLKLGEVVRIAAAAAELPVADAVLADVPCSNTGVLGRRVEVRRRLTAGGFSRLVAVQKELLAQAMGLCKPGGAVVYSTCSIDREENEAVVEAVLAAAGPGRWQLQQSHLSLPKAGVCDGGFFAVLRG